jgi:Zn-dependent protease
MSLDDPLEPLRRFTSASVRLGRIAGSEIRIYWTASLVFLVTWLQVARWTGALPAAGVAAIYTTLLYVVVLTHELGHALAGRLYRMRTPTITLSALGGLAHMDSGTPGPRADIVVSLAGPLTHAVWIGLALLLQPAVPVLRVGDFPVDVMDSLLYLNTALALFNLLPFFPMDGGRVLRGVIALRRHPAQASLWAARVGVFGAIVLGAWGMSDRGVRGTLLIVIAINNLFVCLREIALARWGQGPYAPPRDPWESDADAWRRGASGFVDDPAPRRVGLLARIRGRRRAEPVAPPVETPDLGPVRSAADDAELDRLLGKVGEVGLSGLTDGERATLKRISAARRVPR